MTSFAMLRFRKTRRVNIQRQNSRWNPTYLYVGPGGQGVTKEAGKESVSARWETFIRSSTSPLGKSDNQRPEMVFRSLTHESRQGAPQWGQEGPKSKYWDEYQCLRLDEQTLP